MQTAITECWKRYALARNEQAWDHFVQAILPVYARIVFRVCRQSSPAGATAAEDVLQETLLKLTAQRPNLATRLAALEDHAVEPYLKAFAANAAQDYWRSRRTEKRDERKAISISDLPFLDGILPDHAPTQDRALLFGQIERLVTANASSERDVTAFWLYYRQGFTAREIAAIPEFGLTVKGVESLIFRLTSILRKEFAAGEGAQARGAS